MIINNDNDNDDDSKERILEELDKYKENISRLTRSCNLMDKQINISRKSDREVKNRKLRKSDQ